MSTETTANNSFPFFGLLGLAFIVLKLCGVIDWSWFWVTLPLWGGLAFCMLLLIAYFTLARAED